MEITSSQDYEAQVRACKKCAVEMSRREVDSTCSTERVVPRPIVLQLKAKPLMLIGQAPGLTEYQHGKPFSGQAGADIRRLFAACGCSSSNFERLVHSSAVALCYPGSKLVTKGARSRREDLKPSTAMISNCSSFMQAQLKIVNPRVVVLLGGMPLRAYLQWKTGKAGAVPLAEWVGRVEDWQGRRIMPLAHTSGLSTWLNDPQNKALQEKAKALLTVEIAAALQ